MLSGSTRVLVTHQTQFLPLADKVVILSEGRAVAQGSYAEVVDAAKDTSAGAFLDALADSSDDMQVLPCESTLHVSMRHARMPGCEDASMHGCELFAQPRGRAATQPRSHAATQPRSHAATQPRNHAATQPRGHAATQPRNHATTLPHSHAAT